MSKHHAGLHGILVFLMMAFVFTALPPRGHATETFEQQALVDKARLTFQNFLMDDSMSWVRDNLHKARGLLIVPSLLKAGFILGGSGGSGVLIVRNEETGGWSQPGFYTIGSVSFGLQIGGEAAEVIMVVRTTRAIEKLYASSFKLGGDASFAVGPVGAGAKANVMADIVSFARSKGAYVGLSLEGAVVETRDDWNGAYYGRPVRPTDIFVKHAVSNPGSNQLRKAVARAERDKRPPRPPRSTSNYHVVKRGDTLYGISKRSGVSIRELRRLNNIGQGEYIYPGQKIYLD